MPVFIDRVDAGQQLAQALKLREAEATVVLGLARGGVPVAHEVARALGAPLDILVVRKLQARYVPQLALGAVCADGTRVLKQGVIDNIKPTQQYLDEETERRTAEARRMEARLRKLRAPVALKGQAVCVVDDGAATGATMEAAVLSARHQGAAKVIVAIPVGAVSACKALESAADEVFSLMTPVDFFAIGQFYETFEEVPDEVVERLLRGAPHLSAAM